METLSAFEGAAAALHSNSDEIFCREKEIDALHSFCNRGFKCKEPGVIFLSGSPGTGKTVCANHVIDRFLNGNGAEKRASPKCRNRLSPDNVMSLNAAGMKDCAALLEKLGEFIGIPLKQRRTFRKVNISFLHPFCSFR